MTLTPPFVLFKNQSAEVGGGKELVLGCQNTAIVDAIWVVNQESQSLKFNLDLLKEVGSQAKTIPLVVKKNVEGYESLDVYQDSLLYLEEGDLLYGWTDFSGSRAIVTVSYRELFQSTPSI